MTLPAFTPQTDDRLHSEPITLTTTAQPTSAHSSEPRPLTAAASTSKSDSQQNLLTSYKPWTNELANVKEKSRDVSQPVTEGFATGRVGGASNKGKIKEKKFSMHDSSKGDDEQIVRYV